MNSRIINSLWIGKKLNYLALLTIKSFLYHRHEFVLWTYDAITNLPDGARTANANEIIPSDNIFSTSMVIIREA